MSTRSHIIVARRDGKFAVQYVHFDGYPDGGVGETLNRHFRDPDKIEALSALGDLSALYPSIEKPAGHSFDNKVEGYTVAYGRDRGESDVDTKVFDTLDEAKEYANEEYAYIWQDGDWTFRDHGKPFVNLAEYLKAQEAA